jgi:hypothetical protein
MSSIFDTESVSVPSDFSGKDAVGTTDRHRAGGCVLRELPGSLRAGASHYSCAADLLLFVFGVVRTFVRYRSRNVVEDERDRSIAAIGTRWSNLILWLGLVIVLVLYWDSGSVRSANSLIGILFHLLVLAGCARIVRELVAYRMSA